MNRYQQIIVGAFTAFTLTVPALAAPVGTDVRRTPVVEAIDRVMPAVVNIATERVVQVRDPFGNFIREYFDPYYRRRPQNTTYSLGSGVIIDEEGYLLTNNHVVQRASRVWVKVDGQEYEARLIASDPGSDVALLKINAKNGVPFSTVAFAKDDDLLLGENVIALGNPFGLGGSVSQGILSSKSRRQPREDEALDMQDWLQVDAAINPGNSGGPLINLRGELIGINVAVHSQGQGIGFAIPIRRVAESLGKILTPEKTKSLWFGARIRPGKMPLLVNQVDKNSPASLAGLKQGDLITGIDGKKPVSYISFTRVLLEHGAADRVKLDLLRAKKKLSVSVRLRPEKDFFNNDLLAKKLGIRVEALTAELARRIGLPFYGGYIITELLDDSPAAKAGLEKFHIVHALDERIPRDLIEFGKAAYHAEKGDQVKIDFGFIRRGIFREARTQLEIE
ncbi:MAG: serine protease Do [Limisphaerales bacterium]